MRKGDPTIEQSECVRKTTQSLAESYRRMGILQLVAQNAYPANPQFDGLSMHHCDSYISRYHQRVTLCFSFPKSIAHAPPSAGFNCYVGMKVLYKR